MVQKHVKSFSEVPGKGRKLIYGSVSRMLVNGLSN